MIIRATFNDNDFTQVLEEFFDGPLFLNVKYCLEKYRGDSKEDLTKYFELNEEIESFLRKFQDDEKLSQGEKDRFVHILRDSLTDYINDKYEEDAEYLCEELELKLQKSVTDKWENGEVVYYFTGCDKYITM